jgi:hypothetical protein
MQPSQDRNAKAPQVRVSFEVAVKVLFPEETFTPVQLEGLTQDISHHGMRVRIPHLSEEVYGKILRTVRNAQIELSPPGESEPISVRGRIVWLDFDSRGCHCTFGVTLENTPEETKQRVAALVRDIIAGMKTSTD